MSAAIGVITERKCEKLREFFPPDVIGWDAQGTSQAKISDMLACVPFVSMVAIHDRLDDVLGADSWSERYENPGDFTRCILSVRFNDGQDWVTRVGLSNSKDLARAQAEALRGAALTLGIGRYLTAHVGQAQWDGQRLKSIPSLPDVAKPEEYRAAGREFAQKLRQLIEQCCAESKAKGQKWDSKEAAWLLVSHVAPNFPRDADGHVSLARLERRKVSAILNRCNAWLGELAAGNRNPPSSPFYAEAPKDAAKENPKNTPSQGAAQSQSPQGQPSGHEKTLTNPPAKAG